MKSLAVFLSYLSASLRRRDVRLLLALLGVFVVMVSVCSTLFHVLMDREGQSHSWPIGAHRRCRQRGALCGALRAPPAVAS